MTTGVSLSPASSSDGTPAPVSATPAAPAAPAAAPAPAAPVAAPQGNVSPPTPVVAPGVSLSSPAAQPTGDQSQSPFASASGDYKQLAETKGWKSIDDALKSYQELETKFSSTRPAEAPKDVAAYDAVIQKPDDADKLGYNDNFAKWLKETGIKHKASVEVVKGFHDDFVEWARSQAGSANETQVAQTQERVNKAGTELTKAWGSPNTPKFSRNLDMAMRAINNLSPDLKGALAEVGVIASIDGKEMVTNHVIIDALSKAGAAMFAEDTLFGSTAASINPFDPATLDLTKQTQLFRTDKARAASYIRALKPEQQTRYASMLASMGA